MSASFFGTQTHSKVYRHKVSNGVRRKTYTSPFWPVRFFSKLLLWKKTDWLHFLLSLLSLLHTTQIPQIDLRLRQELREVRYINTAGGVFPLFELLSGLGKIDKKWERLMENQNKSTLPSFCSASTQSPKSRVLLFFLRMRWTSRSFFFLKTSQRTTQKCEKKSSLRTDAPNVLTLEISLDLFS